MVGTAKSPGRNTYFTHRESQELKLAAGAKDRAVRCAHLHMAQRYAILAREDPVVTVTIP